MSYSGAIVSREIVWAGATVTGCYCYRLVEASSPVLKVLEHPKVIQEMLVHSTASMTLAN
ncbi:MAG: hypothetical protein QM451_09580 [Bacillota bacterium]|nr:hypothetical protein [Bacillota bacterium]